LVLGSWFLVLGSFGSFVFLFSDLYPITFKLLINILKSFSDIKLLHINSNDFVVPLFESLNNNNNAFLIYYNSYKFYHYYKIVVLNVYIVYITKFLIFK
jgi:hypothetical protein